MPHEPKRGAAEEQRNDKVKDRVASSYIDVERSTSGGPDKQAAHHSREQHQRLPPGGRSLVRLPIGHDENRAILVITRLGSGLASFASTPRWACRVDGGQLRITRGSRASQPQLHNALVRPDTSTNDTLSEPPDSGTAAARGNAPDCLGGRREAKLVRGSGSLPQVLGSPPVPATRRYGQLGDAWRVSAGVSSKM